jgi:sugar fermentation stimulation protein A
MTRIGRIHANSIREHPPNPRHPRSIPTLSKMPVTFPFSVEPAEFLERSNRFRILARLHSTGEVVAAHCPNPGRLRELLIPHAGVMVYLSREQSDAETLRRGDGQSNAEATVFSSLRTSASLRLRVEKMSPPRKTAYTLRLVAHPADGVLISLDTALPNALVWDALQSRALPPFAALADLRREVSLPAAHAGAIHSRCDFAGQEPTGRRCWIEVKSVSLVEQGVALFPDAVTARGRRHLLELAERVAAGERAAVVFVVQRPDATSVAAHRAADPAFAAVLSLAAATGVELYAWTTQITLTGAAFDTRIAVAA